MSRTRDDIARELESAEAAMSRARAHEQATLYDMRRLEDELYEARIQYTQANKTRWVHESTLNALHLELTDYDLAAYDIDNEE